MSLRDLLRRHAGRAVRVALVVGSVLLMVNQHEALFGEAAVRWWPAALTYCVPFCVFLFGQYSAAVDKADQGKAASRSRAPC